MPGASYSISDFENVSMTNGNVNLSIPLASLPPIAGGKLKMTVSAIYNSKLWNVTRREYQPGTFNGCASWVVDQPQRSERGGWSISGGYTIQIREANEDFNYAVPDPLPGTCETNPYENDRLRNYNWYRVVLITPDGAEHELRPVDSVNRYEGSRGYLYGAYRDTPQTLNTPMRYYTYDGSFMSVVLNPYDPVAYPTQWTVQLNDGTKVTETGGVQRITDTNGNSIKIFTDLNNITHYQDEQTDREIKYTYDPDANNGEGQGQVSYQTVDAIWQTVYINFGTTRVQGKLYRINDWDLDGGELGTGQACWYHGVIPAIDMPVIRKIVYPMTEPSEPNQDARSFSFSYNSDSTSTVTDNDIRWQCEVTQLSSYNRTVSNGMGSLSQVVTPSGATIAYSYSKDGMHNFSQLDQTNEIPRETLTQKQVTHDGITDTWNYNIFEAIACGGTVTAPDGSVTTESCNPKDSAFGQAYTAGEFGGLAVTSIRSGKERIDRHWTSLVFAGGYTNATGVQSIMGNFNPVMDAEYTSLLDASGNRIKMSARTFQYDYNGNMVSETHYDWFDPAIVNFGAGGVPTGVPASATVLRATSNDFYNGAGSSSSSNVYAKRSLSTGLPAVLSALQQTTTGPAITRLSYDGAAYGTAPIKGNITSQSVWNDLANQWITSSQTYTTPYGNLDTKIDPRGNETRFFYDDLTHALPTRVVVDPENGSGTQTTTTAYDFSTGAVISQTDVNGNTSTIDYTNQLLNAADPFGRPGVTIGPDQGGGLNHRVKTIYGDSARTVTVLADLHAEGDGLLKSQTLSDMLGRTIETRRYETASAYIAVRKSFDTANRLQRTSTPFRAGEALLWTTTASDVLGRVISVTTPDSAVVGTSYSGNTVTVTDQADKQRKSVTDALGRLKEVYEDPNGLNYLTSYSYDALDNLTTVIQGSQTRTFVYDSLKRLVSATNPESGTICYGTVVSSNCQPNGYDANGNLVYKTDARGILSTYAYDALNRNTSVDYSNTDTINPDITRTYDTATNGKGRLRESYAGGTETAGATVEHTKIHSYDALGRPLDMRQRFKTASVWSGEFPVGREYSLVGGVKTQTYPSGRMVIYNYDNAGRLGDKDAQNLAFSGTLGDGVTRTYSSGNIYSPLGGMTKEQFGTDTVLYNKSFYNSRGQLAEIRVGTYHATDGTWWNRGAIINHYSNCWGMCGGSNSSTPMTDNNGNLKKQDVYIPENDGITSQKLWTQQFDYDALNRLKWVKEFSGGTTLLRQEYEYDRYGNRTIEQDVLKTFGAGVNNKNFTVNTANNRLGVPSGYSERMDYDAAGNLINDTYTSYGRSDGLPTRIYDAENRLTTAKDGNLQDVSSYTYNADGQRVRRKIAGVETWGVYGFDGELLAEYPANTAAATPEKEYGYRNGQLLITAVPTTQTYVSQSFVLSKALGAQRADSPGWTGFKMTTGAQPVTISSLGRQCSSGNSLTHDLKLIRASDNATLASVNVSMSGCTVGQFKYGTLASAVTLSANTAYLLVSHEVGADTFHDWTGTVLSTMSVATVNHGVYTTNGGVTWGPAGSTGNSYVPLDFKYHTPPSQSLVTGKTLGAQRGDSPGWTGFKMTVGAQPVTVSSLGRHCQAGNSLTHELRLIRAGDNATLASVNVSMSGCTAGQFKYGTLASPVTLAANTAYLVVSYEVGSDTFHDWTGTALSTTSAATVNHGVYTTNGGVTWGPAGSTGNSYVPLDLQYQTGSIGTANVQWLVADQLGTPRMVFDQTGALATTKRHDYLPFGEELVAGQGLRTSGVNGLGYNADTTRQKFTSKERDIETGLDYFLARYYSSVQGRFTSPDEFKAGAYEFWLLGDPSVGEKQAIPFGDIRLPQSLNKYQYCYNNPLKFIDPNGHDALLIDNKDTGKTTILIPVHFTGPSATPGLISEVISRASQLDTGDPNVTIQIVATKERMHGVLNTLTLSPELDPKHTREGQGVEGRGGNKGHIRSNGVGSGGAIVHELLHMAGLKDRYVEDKPKNGQRTTKPAKGYDNSNIMTSNGGTKLNGTQIKEAKDNGSTKKCTTEKGITKCN